MAKRDTGVGQNFGVLDNEYNHELEAENVLEKTENTSYNNLVKLQLMIGVKSFAINGPATGKHYLWSGAGSVVEVLQEDVAGLLSKRLGGRPCCGGENSNKIFEMVKE